jgi:pyruvate/2-oxoglutarate/acetoin dehydrogenase E1 component
MRSTMRCAQVLNESLHRLFAEQSDVVLIGEDLLDPYGGAFKVSAGLSTRWPDRVLTTPISEAAIVGMAGGMALRGLRPIVEIMFGDFTALACDQIVNHLAKFRAIYHGQVSCPVVIRTPMGGRRGYGPTHSQSLEKLFLGVPGLTVVAPSRHHDLGEMLHRAVLETTDPVLFVENKLMYGQPHQPPREGRIAEFAVRTTADRYPTLTLSLNDFAPPDVTVVTYGGMLPLAMEGALELAMEHELFAEIVAPSQLSPLPAAELVAALGRSRRLIVAEEGTRAAGWGAEVVARLMDESDFHFASARVAAKDAIIPTSRPLEDAVLPQPKDIVAAALKIVSTLRP